MNRVCEVAVIYVIAPNPYLFHGFLWVYHILFTPFLRLKLSCEFAEYSQQDAKFHNLLISVRRSTCFKRVFRPSSGAQNCTYSVRYLSDCNDIVKNKLLITVYINCSGK